MKENNNDHIYDSNNNLIIRARFKYISALCNFKVS